MASQAWLFLQNSQICLTYNKIICLRYLSACVATLEHWPTCNVCKRSSPEDVSNTGDSGLLLYTSGCNRYWLHECVASIAEETSTLSGCWGVWLRRRLNETHNKLNGWTWIKKVWKKKKKVLLSVLSPRIPAAPQDWWSEGVKSNTSAQCLDEPSTAAIKHHRGLNVNTALRTTPKSGRGE